MALIDVDHLSFAYDATPVLRDVSLSVEAGEKLAILGGNGSGKSTLAQWIAGWLPRGTFAASEGGVTVEGRPWAELDAATRAGSVQFVGQVPMQQLSGFTFTVLDEIAFGPGNLQLPEPEIRARVAAAVETCNLGHLLERDPFSLSGGEQQRLSIAAALAMQPRALVLDEPTGNFDPESRDALLAQMEKLPAELAIVWCDVTLGAAMAVASRFVLLDEGRIAYDGDAAGLLAHPRTAQIFGLPAVAEAALLWRAAGVWPEGVPISADPARVAAVLRPMLEEVA
ncbi:MAG: energy-coupling factor ABC transporter ATP-binding protein [Salipiger thiooxidans]|uniref:energy-coupling factor ABC transporter ATP-binding protein n=1 Tax=Salipiger thiooxidans TaxID=282683 RepID=UPI001CFBA089|nr:ABC transporter ATP-binding protein [Salipiger thiooxidans]